MILTYVFISFLLTLLLAIDIARPNIRKRYVYIGVISILFVFLFYFRDFNTDFEAYVEFFTNLESYNQSGVGEAKNKYSFEAGFIIYSYIGTLITDSGKLFYTLTAILISSVYWYIFAKDEDRYLQYLMVYFSTFFIFNELIQIRQGTATCLIVLACYLYSRSSKSAFLFFTPALFHSSTILSILILPLKFINRRWFFIVFLLFSIVYGYTIGVDFIFQVEFIKSYIPEKLMSYYLSVYSLDITIDTARNIKYLVLCYLIFHFWDDFSKNQFYSLIAKVYVFGIALSFALSSFYILSIRIGQLFMVFEVILIPFLISLIFSNPKVRAVATYLVSTGLLYKSTISML
ncbi:EpsG family protein [Grimontia sp. NTOU-MAR1]|uniref:EpsG family protein n=1 Tax=Grimontia sp. NTOU-MAR1 TaxID=3111011 RepID=UPI003FA37DA7